MIGITTTYFGFQKRSLADAAFQGIEMFISYQSDHPITAITRLPVLSFDRPNVSPDWELSFGVGVGVTCSMDHLIVNAVIGRLFKLGPQGEEGGIG